MPETGGSASVFIDIIGMPRTPLSFAAPVAAPLFVERWVTRSRPLLAACALRLLSGAIYADDGGQD